LRIKTK